MPISGDILLPYLLAGGCWCDHGHIVATSVIALGSETIGIWGHSFFFADPATTWRIILVTSKQSYRSLVALTHVWLGETTVIMPPIAGLQKTATLRKKRNISGDETWLAGISTQKFEDFPAINLSFEFVGFLPRHVS